jgi:hypothetical protein
MKAPHLFVLWLWIASHVVPTHGDDTLASLLLRRREIQEKDSRTVTFLFAILILLTDEGAIEQRRLRRERRRCRFFLKSDCICWQLRLIRAIRENREAKICVDTSIELTREIDITGKNFTIACAKYHSSYKQTSCKIVGRGRHRLFKGSPTNANFLQIDIESGSATEGGIALLTGGLTRFQGGSISKGRASGDGGAIHITGGTLVLFNELRNNSALGNGGADCCILYVEYASVYSRNIVGKRSAAPDLSAINHRHSSTVCSRVEPHIAPYRNVCSL